MRVSIFWLAMSVLLSIACFSPVVAAQLVNSTDKIEVDADSTGADAVSGRLTFTNISIRQGAVSISANTAESSSLDFSNSTWTFRGKVRLTSPTASVEASQLELRFANRRIRSAMISGSPLKYIANNNTATQIDGQSADVRFSNSAITTITLTGSPLLISRAGENGARTEGQANTVNFDAATENLELLGDARLGEGGNQITGNRITYNLKTRRVLAAANEQGDGRVRIVIDPTENNTTSTDTSLTEDQE